MVLWRWRSPAGVSAAGLVCILMAARIVALEAGSGPTRPPTLG